MVGRLDHFDPEEGIWKAILIEDQTAGPAENGKPKSSKVSVIDQLQGKYRTLLWPEASV